VKLLPSAGAAFGSALSIVVAVTAGCGTPAGGDPGGRRLRELAADRVFATTPREARGVGVRRIPAVYRHPAFQGAGWDGPTVVVSFADSAPLATVYRFYARRAAAAGWRPGGRNGLGFTDRWAKTYPDGAAATLALLPASKTWPASRRRYRLAGSTSTVDT
jgi:hypothetical protein